ncbi:MAG: hypothetical protein ABSG28_10300 [Methanoregula sp.]|jgi:hypothetical protein|uniref:hypothetical protein n=1 Tax=Methanoregula sp. TaxID=2052170 RepID=UPI003C1486A4
MISFDRAYRILQTKGPAQIESREGTKYTVYAHIPSKGDHAGEFSIRAIVYNEKGKASYIYVHADCWGKTKTCKGTWAGGLYDGVNSLIKWLEKHDSKSNT